MIPFYLVTGFLGSGKTTFLKEVLTGYSGNSRIAIIQNEFAPTGVDGKELKLTGHGFHLEEVNNGSVFCVCLMATFVESLKKVIESYRPDMIFLEASGLSDPVNIIELMAREGLNDRVSLAHVFAVVDAQNFDKGIKTLPRSRHQIMIADTVIVNKSDIFTGSYPVLHEQIRDMNPFAEIIPATHCRADLERLISGPTERHEASAAMFAGVSEGRPDIKACVLRAHQKLTGERLMSFILELQKYSPRIKGYVNIDNGIVVAVQTVFEISEMKEMIGYSGPTEIIAFGRDLTPRFLRDLLKKHSAPVSGRLRIK